MVSLNVHLSISDEDYGSGRGSGGGEDDGGGGGGQGGDGGDDDDEGDDDGGGVKVSWVIYCGNNYQSSVWSWSLHWAAVSLYNKSPISLT